VNNIPNHLKLTKNVRHRSIGDEGVLLRQTEGEVVLINELGTRILEHIEKGSLVDRMIAMLEKEYDVSSENLQNDTTEFLQQLIDLDVIETA
jgi:hypothetical protein